MNRLDHKLSKPGPLLTCYLPVGDPLIPIEYADIYAEYGVDIVELGMPSPNPYMDGADVSASMARARATGAMTECLPALTDRIKAHFDGPAAICMCYADLDIAAILDAGAFDGIDGLLMLGLDGRADQEVLKAEMRSRAVRLINLVSTDLPAADIAAAGNGDGYIMLQAAGGVTGPRESLDPANAAKVAQLRGAGLTQKILLGFGIGTAEQAAQAVRYGADGVIIGSMCVRKAIEGPESLRAFLTDVRNRLDG